MERERTTRTWWHDEGETIYCSGQARDQKIGSGPKKLIFDFSKRVSVSSHD